jgi:transcription initiation factor TFIID subunit 7
MNTKPTPNKKKVDGIIDQEQQFILRLPPGPAMALRHDVQTGAMNLKDKLSIELASDARHGKLTYGGYVFNTKLVDLPCIIESLKTTDRKSFYKTADISQMLICTNDDEEIPIEVDSPKKKEKDKRYIWNHGICPPLKNARKKRFRKVLQKKYQEQPDIEKEVKRLFRMDNEAMDIKWEIVVEEEKGQDQVTSSLRDDNDDSMPVKSKNLLGLVDIFGDVSSSDEDDEEDAEREVTSRDNRDEPQVDNKEQSVDFTGPEVYDPEIPVLQNDLQELGRQLGDLQEKRILQEMEISILDNSVLKEKLQSELDSVIKEESRKRHDYEILSSVLNQ